MPEATTNPVESNEVWRLWEGKAPGALGDAPGDVPTLTVYRPDKPDGSSIVVCPGGAYQMLAPHEGPVIAHWLTTLGITAFVLKYRLAPRYQHPAPLLDVSRAIRTVRHRVKDFSPALDASRIGVMGFSAGGHLTGTVSTLYDSDERSRIDATDHESARPDVSILCYPVITLDGVSAHVGSRKALLGDHPTKDQLDSLSADLHVTPHTPPAFLFHTVADAGVPVENSMLYAAALRKAGVPFEMHLFEPGPHGVGLATQDPALKTWPALCATWLAGKKFGWAGTKPE